MQRKLDLLVEKNLRNKDLLDAALETSHASNTYIPVVTSPPRSNPPSNKTNVSASTSSTPTRISLPAKPVDAYGLSPIPLVDPYEPKNSRVSKSEKNRCDQLNINYSQIVNQRDRCEHEKNVCLNEKKDLFQRLQNKDKELTTLLGECDKLKSYIRDNDRKVDTLSIEYNQLQSSIDGKNQELQGKDQEILKLQTDLTSLDQKQIAQDIDLKDLRKQLNQSQSTYIQEVAYKDNQIKNLSQQVDQLKLNAYRQTTLPAVSLATNAINNASSMYNIDPLEYFIDGILKRDIKLTGNIIHRRPRKRDTVVTNSDLYDLYMTWLNTPNILTMFPRVDLVNQTKSYFIAQLSNINVNGFTFQKPTDQIHISDIKKTVSAQIFPI